MPTKPKAKSSATSQNEVVFAILAYIGILFIVPLLAAKDSKFAMYHANQGLVLFLAELIAGFAAAILSVALIGFLLMPLVWLVSFILMIIGILNAANKQMKPLPIIGGITLIK